MRKETTVPFRAFVPFSVQKNELIKTNEGMLIRITSINHVQIHNDKLVVVGRGRAYESTNS